MYRLALAVFGWLMAASSLGWADDRLRVDGSVLIQDVNRSYEGAEIKERFGDDGEISIIWDTTRADFSKGHDKLDDIGRYNFYGRYQAGYSGDIAVELSARVSGFETIEPIHINIHDGAAVVTLRLRSPGNASAAIFNRCNVAIEKAGGLKAVPQDPTATSDILYCLNSANVHFKKPEITETIGDILDRNGDYSQCVSVFDGLSEVYRTNKDRPRFERALLRSVLCRERMALRSLDTSLWGDVAVAARNGVGENIRDKNVRLQMLRIWYDSFLHKVRSDGNLVMIAHDVFLSSALHDEWVSIFYDHYFWGKRGEVPRHRDEAQIFDEMMRISHQFDRTYN